MKPSSDFGSVKKVSSRETVLAWYTLAVVALFIFVLSTAKEKSWTTLDMWQFASGFCFGNILGFYVAVAKYRVNIFFVPDDIFDYALYFFLALISLAAIFLAVWLLSGHGRAAAVIGAVVAVVIFIPATLESWFEAKQEMECLRAIRHECKKY